MKKNNLSIAAVANDQSPEITLVIEQTPEEQHEEAIRLISLLLAEGKLFTQYHMDSFLHKFSPMYNVSHPMLTKLADPNGIISVSDLSEPARIHNALVELAQTWSGKAPAAESSQALKDVLSDFTSETERIPDQSSQTPPLHK